MRPIRHLIVAAAGMSTALSGAFAQDSTQLVIQSWGGVLTEAEKAAFYDPFSEATGIEIRIVEAGAEAGSILKRQIASGRVTWDVMTGFPPETMGQFYEEGLLAEINYANVPTGDDLADGAKLPFAIGYDVETAVPAYSTREGVKPLSSMKDFFDIENFPGPRMAPNWGTASMQCEMALLADGVSPDELYPLDTERCFAVWDRVKDSVSVWFGSGSQMAQALVENAVDYCICWDGRVHQARLTNPEWDYVFDGAMSYFDYAGVVRGSPKAELVERLFEFMASPEAQAEYSKRIHYGPSNPNAVELLPESMKERSAVVPENMAVIHRRPADRIADINAGNEALERAWASWIAR